MVRPICLSAFLPLENGRQRRLRAFRREKIRQKRRERLGIQMAGELAFARRGNDARFFRNDQHHSIGRFRNAQRRAMPRAQFAADGRIF